VGAITTCWDISAASGRAGTGGAAGSGAGREQAARLTSMAQESRKIVRTVRGEGVQVN